ncbi:RNA polymerase sigma factor, partial [Streptomyces hawaiiensis]|uniref:RNA polymerase sigma factor n=1 Tax=Streptomyces hawaiiensis TaxID=67305 RepID=UPI00364791B0
MKDAGPSNSPAPARRFGATDEQLSAELKKWTGATPALHPVGELLDRHWEAAFAYARLCTDGPRSAGMLTTAAFTRLFGETLRQNGPTSAWRPHLLVTVRRIAAEWAGDHRHDMLHPELLAGTGDGERPVSRLLPSQCRRLLSGAFQRLPQAARCLLWHVEVEAEPLTSPAGLLGLDEEGARVELGRARDRLREECLQLHRELAPEEECRRYLRLLDVTYRRGGLDIDPDLRAHIEGCGHCSAAADQLDQFNHALGAALSEAVLGWGGRAYAESRVRDTGATAAVGGSGGVAGAATAPGPAGPAREAFPDPDGVFPDPVGVAREVFRDAVGVAHEVSRDPVDVARDVFPDPAGAAQEVFPDPVALAGTVGESFTEPGGPAPLPPPPGAGAGPRARSGRADAAGGTALPPVPARARLAVPPVAAPPATAPPLPTASPAPRPEGARAAARRSGRSAHKAARRAARRRNLTVSILTVSGLVVLPLVLWSTGNSGDGAPAGADRPAGEAPDSDAGEA